MWPHGCSGRRRPRPLCVPVGGGPPASRPRRELRSARRLEDRPGPVAAHRHRASKPARALRSLRRPPHQWCLAADRRVVSKPGQALPPPTGTAAGSSGALHTSGAGSLIGASPRSPARPCRRPPAPQPGPAVLFVLAAVVLRWRAYVCAREKVRPASLCHRESAKKLALRAQNNSNSAFLRSLGEFFRGNAAGGGVPGEFFRESAVE